jgi:hypothetical protein
MNNNEEDQSDIVQDIDEFLNEGKNVKEAPGTPVPVNEEEEAARAAFIAKRRALEGLLPPPRALPLSRIGVVEAKPGKYRDEETGDEWEIPNYTHDPRTPDVPQSREELLKRKKSMNSLEKQFYDQAPQDWETQINMAIEMKIPAVIVVGESGVGKTTMIENEASKHGLKVAYFNAPTMDPYLQLVGIPYVEKSDLGKSCLRFVRKHDLEHVDMIFLDEINRVTQATQNQLFELVAAHSINGVPFRRLRSVWAAINPPREDITRYVQEMDAALAGRWYVVIHVEAAPRIHHYVGPRDQIGTAVAETCLSWWYSEIKDKTEEGKGGQMVHLQDIINPRVLYYIMWVVQRLNNSMFNPHPGETPITMKQWNTGFNMITQHHKLSSKTWGVNMPFEQLKRALLGNEIVALSMLRNDSPEIEKWINLVKTDTLKAIELAGKLEVAMRSTTLEGPAKISKAELGDFSQIISAMPPEASGKIMRQDIAWYLWAKVHETPERRKAIAAELGDPNDPIVLPMTNGERDIYTHLQKIIDRIITTNKELGIEKKQPVGRAPTAPGGAKVAGGLGAPRPGAPGGGGGKPAMPFGTAVKARPKGISHTPSKAPSAF